MGATLGCCTASTRLQAEVTHQTPLCFKEATERSTAQRLEAASIKWERCSSSTATVPVMPLWPVSAIPAVLTGQILRDYWKDSTDCSTVRPPAIKAMILAAYSCSIRTGRVIEY